LKKTERGDAHPRNLQIITTGGTRARGLQIIFPIKQKWANREKYKSFTNIYKNSFPQPQFKWGSHTEEKQHGTMWIIWWEQTHEGDEEREEKKTKTIKNSNIMAKTWRKLRGGMHIQGIYK
jgi:hypothetical protein